MNTHKLLAPCPPGYEPAIHDACGQVCFYIKTGVQPSDRRRASMMLYPDGTAPSPTDRYRCVACTAPGTPFYRHPVTGQWRMRLWGSGALTS